MALPINLVTSEDLQEIRQYLREELKAIREAVTEAAAPELQKLDRDRAA